MLYNDALRISNLSLKYKGESGVLALRNLSLSLKEGEFIALLGPSGCGKSSLLHVIAGFINPTEGSCFSFGNSITCPGTDRGILFQQHTLFPWRTAIGNVMYPLRCKGIDKQEAFKIAQNWLCELGLEGFEKRHIWELSGGMQQRVALARLYAASPRIFLMDEPFGALDAYTKLEMQEVFLEIWEQHRGTVLFVTHDIEETLLLADRVLVMSARPGTIIDEFSVPLRRPRNIDALHSSEVITLRRHIFSIMRQQHRKKTLTNVTTLVNHKEKRLIIGYVPDFASLPLLSALDKMKDIGEYRIEIMEEPNGEAIVDGVESGTYDLGMNSLVAAISSAQRGRKFKIIAGWEKPVKNHHKFIGLCIPSETKNQILDKPNEIRIGINGLDTVPGFLVRRYFHKLKQKVNLVSLYHGTFTYALREGFVDGIATIEPWLTDVSKTIDRCQLTYLDDLMPPGPAFVLFANENTMRFKKEAIINFLDICRINKVGYDTKLNVQNFHTFKYMSIKPEHFPILFDMRMWENVKINEIEFLASQMQKIGMLPEKININWPEYVMLDNAFK